MKNYTNYAKKRAFTLFEAIVCFAIMGAVFVSTITSIKINDKYDKLYWLAFDTLLQASKNSYTAFSPECVCEATGQVSGCGDAADCVCWSQKCWNTVWTDPANPAGGTYRIETLHNGGTAHTRAWPGFLYGNESVGDYDGKGTDKAFCELLTSRINTLTPIGECRSFISGVNPKKIKDAGVNFYEAFCTSSDKEEPCIGHEIEPSFVAANGQRFYISSVLTANAIDPVFGTNYQRSSYRFIAVDLNGSAGPNTQFKTALRYPDIVLFAINSTGDVIPLGLPEFYMNYIKAVVQYDEYTDEVDPTDPTKFKKNEVLESNPMRLWDARKHAWGPEAGNAAGTLYGQGYHVNEPLSSSSVFYYNANSCVGKSCAGNTGAETIYVDDLYTHLVMQFLYLAENSTELPKDLTMSVDIGVARDKGCTTNSSVCKIEFVRDR